MEWLRGEAAGEPARVREALEREIEIVSRAVVDGQRLQDYFVMLFSIVQTLRSAGIRFSIRGSGVASHMVRLMAGRTTPDPDACGCLFERFINQHRVSMPDVDIDVPDQESAIRAIAGRFQVVRLAAYSRVNDVDSILRGVAFGMGIAGGHLRKDGAMGTLMRGLGKDEAERMRGLAEQLIGKLGHIVERVSQHAGGFVVLPSGMAGMLPVFPADVLSSDIPVCQLDMDLLPFKIDILQVDALRAIYPTGLPAPCRIGPAGRIPHEPLLVSSAGIFQLNSALSGPLLFSIAEAASQAGGLVFEDIIQLVAGIRPGAFGMLASYLRGRGLLPDAHRQFLHVAGWEIDAGGSGFVFQEDVMRAVAAEAVRCGMQEAEAWKLADLVRKAIAKKDSEAWERARSVLAGAGADGGLIRCLEASLGYSFNRSHAVAYAYHAAMSIQRLNDDPITYLLDVARQDLADRAFDRLAHSIFALLIHALRAGMEVRITTEKSMISGNAVLLGPDVLGDGARASPQLSFMSALADDESGESLFGFPLRLIADVAPLAAFPRRHALVGVTGYYKNGTEMVPAIFTPHGIFRGPSARGGPTPLYRHVVGTGRRPPRAAVFIPLRGDASGRPAYRYPLVGVRSDARHREHRGRIAI